MTSRFIIRVKKNQQPHSGHFITHGLWSWYSRGPRTSRSIHASFYVRIFSTWSAIERNHNRLVPSPYMAGTLSHLLLLQMKYRDGQEKWIHKRLDIRSTGQEWLRQGKIGTGRMQHCLDFLLEMLFSLTSTYGVTGSSNLNSYNMRLKVLFLLPITQSPKMGTALRLLITTAISSWFCWCSHSQCKNVIYKTGNQLVFH